MVSSFFERNVAGLGIFSGPLSLSRFLKDLKVSTLTLGENFIRFVFKLEPIIYSLINIFYLLILKNAKITRNGGFLLSHCLS